MGKPSRNFREGFLVFDLKIRIISKPISLSQKNQFYTFLQKKKRKDRFFKPVI